MVLNKCTESSYETTDLFHKKYSNNLLDHHRPPVWAWYGGGGGPSFIPRFDDAGRGNLDFFVYWHPAVTCGTDLSEGFVIQLGVDREHKYVIDRCHGLNGRVQRVENRWSVHQRGTHLTNNLLLEVKCSSDDCYGINVKIATVPSRGGVHGDEFLQF